MEVKLQNELETEPLFRLQIIYLHDTGRSEKKKRRYLHDMQKNTNKHVNKHKRSQGGTGPKSKCYQ